MKLVGFILIAIGASGLAFTLNIDTTVETSRVPTGMHIEARDNSLEHTEETLSRSESTPYAPSARVHNLGLIFHKISWLLVSSVILVCGVLFYGFGFLGGQKSLNEQWAARNAKQSPQQPPVSLPPRERRRSVRTRLADRTNQAEAAMSLEPGASPLSEPRSVHQPQDENLDSFKTSMNIDSIANTKLGQSTGSTRIAAADDADLHEVLNEITEINEAQKEMKVNEIEKLIR